MVIIELLKAFILGVVQGITEWLPISSTGHMILVDEFIKMNFTDAFMEMFFVVIQFGGILAVVVLYFNKLNPLSMKKSTKEKKDTMQIWYRVVIGCIPAAVVGLLLDDWFNEHFYNYQTVAFTLIIYGILFIIIENRNKDKEPIINNFHELSYMTAFLIGVFQVLALIPGTSRSGATIIGAILLGASRHIAAEYSFFLSVPIMFGASALKIVKFGFKFTDAEIAVLLVAMATAFIVSIVAIRFLLSYIKKNNFKIFGWYRIVLGAIVIIYFAFLA